MAPTDQYRELNAFQELRSQLVELVGNETAAIYEERLARALNPEETRLNLPRAVRRCWHAIEDSATLVQAVRTSLGYEDGFRLPMHSLPGPEIHIKPGPRYCCPVPTCDRYFYQLFDGQSLCCPVHKFEMRTCDEVIQKRKP